MQDSRFKLNKHISNHFLDYIMWLRVNIDSKLADQVQKYLEGQTENFIDDMIEEYQEYGKVFAGDKTLEILWGLNPLLAEHKNTLIEKFKLQFNEDADEILDGALAINFCNLIPKTC